MIDTLTGVKVGDLYTKTGLDVWEVKTFCENPTITLVNIRTHEKELGAIGSLNVKDFVQLVKKDDE